MYLPCRSSSFIKEKVKSNVTFLIPFLHSSQVSLNQVVCGTEAEAVFGTLAGGTTELFASQVFLCRDSVHELIHKLLMLVLHT